ncbi:MAG: RDD family protein [Cellvibrionaceae bacterium]|nr:RDD family protein [Cellvibrionaceae bacterium]
MENNVYSTPESELISKEEEHAELASRWSRLGAALVDAIIMIPISITLMYFTGGFDVLQTGTEPGIIYNFMIGIANLIFYMLINGRFLLANGQTLGKKLLNIKIVSVDGKKAELNHLLKRYGFYFFIALFPVVGPLLSLVNILFVFSKSKRCLHDLVAGTHVVKA